mmetsp:Transcript_117198/g.373306  ORF Transcript_117198/g.373306 Transcript_117198/m.373306 type:complete len:189 (+) Transcript_117198:46-612(+)
MPSRGLPITSGTSKLGDVIEVTAICSVACIILLALWVIPRLQTSGRDPESPKPGEGRKAPLKPQVRASNSINGRILPGGAPAADLRKVGLKEKPIAGRGGQPASTASSSISGDVIVSPPPAHAAPGKLRPAPPPDEQGAPSAASAVVGLQDGEWDPARGSRARSGAHRVVPVHVAGDDPLRVAARQQN